jgi:hypothetical protein
MSIRRARRQRKRWGALLPLLALTVLLPTGCQFTPLPGAPNCRLTPVNSFWRSNVTGLSAHPSSTTWKNSNNPGDELHADFGSGLWDGGPIGIPYVVVPGSQPRKPVTFRWPSESHPGPYPIPNNPPIEGGPNAPSGADRHILMLDKDTCHLWELYNANPVNGGASWTAGSGVRWDTTSNQLWPAGWTSADASGMGILPGLVRYEEVEAGVIRHAIRITLPRTRTSYVWPATHQAGESSSTSLPPMGSWLRLGSHIDPDDFGPQARPIVVALQTYGAILADNGSAWYISGAPDSRWDNDQLHELDVISGSDFTFVDAQPMKVANGSGESNRAS